MSRIGKVDLLVLNSFGQNPGMSPILGALIGGGTTIVWVTIDGQQLQGRIDRTVRAGNNAVGRQLSNGPRGLVAR